MSSSTENTLKLLDALADLYEKGHRTVRIGCWKGSAFVYTGAIADINFKSINEQSKENYRHLQDLAEDRMRKAAGSLIMAGGEKAQARTAQMYKAAKKNLDIIRGKITDFTKYEDRKVISITPSTVDSDMIVIIEGDDGWEQYKPAF